MQERALRELLVSLGVRKIGEAKHNGQTTWIMGCCPIHNENNPSFGANVDGFFNCFGCQEEGHLIKLIQKVTGCSFKEAVRYYTKYDEEYVERDDKGRAKFKTFRKITELDVDEKKKREKKKGEIEYLPMYTIAPFRSGKVAHRYLLERGITKESCKKFMLGFDMEHLRITVPAFSLDNKLYGYTSRAVIDDKKEPEHYTEIYGDEPKYLISPGMPKTKMLYPLPHFVLPEDKTAIIVEGFIDAIMMHQHGYTNTLSIITAKCSDYQLEMMYMQLGIRKLVLMLDNDYAGRQGTKRIREMAGKSFLVYNVTWKDGYNDPGGTPKNEIEYMLRHKKLLNFSFTAV